MITICAVGKKEIERIIEKVTKESDPTGLIFFLDSFHEINQRIKDIQADVVWLEAAPESISFASELRDTSDRINIIFTASTGEMAFAALSVRASGYIREPVTEEAVRKELENLRYPVLGNDGKLKVQCFGNFEVFINGSRVRFSRSLSKEAFAYLIDRKGAGCTVREICSVLWEDRPADTNLKSQCRVILSGLRRDLQKAGADGVILKGWNSWGIDTEKLTCDYYDYLRDKEYYANTFTGEYMSQYSWAELTRGGLFHMSDD